MKCLFHGDDCWLDRADAKEEELERYICPECRWGGLFRGTTMVHHIDGEGNVREFDRTDTWIVTMEQKICPIHGLKLEKVWFREGYCYQDVAKYVMDHKDWKLVHGRIHRPHQTPVDHAWAERGNEVWEPQAGAILDKDDWYRFVLSRDAEYTWNEAWKLLVKTETYGPWTEEERLNKADYKDEEHFVKLDESRKLYASYHKCSDAEKGKAGACLTPAQLLAMIRLADARVLSHPLEWDGYIDGAGMLRAKAEMWGGKALAPKMFTTDAVLFHTHPVSSRSVDPSPEDWQYYMMASTWWGFRKHVLTGRDVALVMLFPVIKKGFGDTNLRDRDAVGAYVTGKLKEAEGETSIEKAAGAVKLMGGRALILSPENDASVVFYDEGPGGDRDTKERGDPREEKIEFETFAKDRSQPDVTGYKLRILVNGKNTSLFFDGESYMGKVEGDIIVQLGSYDTDPGEFELHPNLNKGYWIKVEGNITHMKKQIVEEWPKIKEWARQFYLVAEKAVKRDTKTFGWTEWGEGDPLYWRLYIPTNDYGIPEGRYSINQIVELLKKHKEWPGAVEFLADIMEI